MLREEREASREIVAGSLELMKDPDVREILGLVLLLPKHRRLLALRWFAAHVKAVHAGKL